MPVLFEVASHINRARDGVRRRSLSETLFRDIKSSIEQEGPWTVAAMQRGVLFRSQDLICLAERFLRLSGPNYSFADISIMDLAEQLCRTNRAVVILTYDSQLAAYSDSIP